MEDLFEVFPNIINDGCLIELKLKHYFVFEDDIIKKGRLVNATEKHHLHIENQTKKSFYFIQNDDCVMKGVKGGQCDYIIFNNQIVFFTEIKATNDNLSKRRIDAVRQLENTIKFYSKKDLFVNHESKNAIITFEKAKRIAPQASSSSKRKEFKVKYNIDLQEGNYILFE